jgi:SH3 domain
LETVDEFVARSPDEISLFKLDRIELLEKDDDFGDGWYLGRHIASGKTGLFPAGKTYNLGDIWGGILLLHRMLTVYGLQYIHK